MAEDLQLKMYISARTEQLELALQKAEQKTQQTMQKINAAQAAPGGGIGGGPSFAGGELIGGLAKGVVTIAAIQGGLQLVHAAVRAMKGDWQGVEQVVRRLPGGIGGIIGTVIDLQKELSGTANEAERLKKAAEALKTAVGAERGFTGGPWATAVENARAEAEARGGKIGGARFDMEQAIKKHQLEAAAAQREIAPLRESDLVQWSQLSGNIDEALAGKIAAEQEKFARIQADAQQDAADEAKKVQDKQAQEQEKYLERMRDLRGKYRVEEARETTGELAARLEEIENAYRERIRTAEAGEVGLLHALAMKERGREVALDAQKRREATMAERGREYDLQARARDQAESRVRSRIAAIQGQSLSAEDAGFLTRAPGTDRTAELVDEGNKINLETQRILNDMRQEQRKRKEFVEVGFP